MDQYYEQYNDTLRDWIEITNDPENENIYARQKYFRRRLLKLRLASRIGFCNLRELAWLEYNLLKIQNDLQLPSLPYPHHEDDISEHDVEFTCKDLKVDFKNLVPISVAGDGNCFFRAISFLMFGSEALALECRFRTVLELVLNRHFYLAQDTATAYANFSGSDYFGDGDYVDEIFKSECIETCRIGEFANMWHVHAMANVFGVNIKSIYPPQNGFEDGGYQALNKIVLCRSAISETEDINILWSRVGYQDNNLPDTWVPNHFVPCLEVQSNEFFVEKEDANECTYFT